MRDKLYMWFYTRKIRKLNTRLLENLYQDVLRKINSKIYQGAVLHDLHLQRKCIVKILGW